MGAFDNIMGAFSPFGSLSPQDPRTQQKMLSANMMLGLGGNLLANSQGPMGPAIGKALQGMQQQGAENAQTGLIFKKFQDEQADRKAEQDKASKWQNWVTANKDKFGQYGDIAPFLSPSESMKLMGGGELFSGNSTEAQALNHLVKNGELLPGQADQIAAGKPITTPDGQIRFFTPQDIVGAANGSGMNGQQTAQTGAVPQEKGIALTGKKPMSSEDMKAVGLYEGAKGAIDEVNKNFDKMSADKTSIAAGTGGFEIGKMFQSDVYQKTKISIGRVAQNYLYSTSGATANPGETQKTIESVTPTFFDSDEAKKTKKILFNDMVRNLEVRARLGIQPGMPLPPQAEQELEAAKQQEAQTGNLKPNEDGSYTWSPQ